MIVTASAIAVIRMTSIGSIVTGIIGIVAGLLVGIIGILIAIPTSVRYSSIRISSTAALFLSL